MTIALTVIGAVLGSTGLSQFITFLISRYDSKKSLANRVGYLESRETKLTEKMLTMGEGQIALLHNSIYKSAMEYLDNGFVTESQLDNLNTMYKAYSALGGNSTGDLIMSRVRDLKIVKG